MRRRGRSRSSNRQSERPIARRPGYNPPESYQHMTGRPPTYRHPSGRTPKSIDMEESK